uniref:Uncharacterized protein n=1 Tax=Leptospira santarosai serovar Arenal str. MAVJ 401 TaxID=1049976 RepID=M6JCR0_9LEPT|nr:hypothetical protein LEP1GSC063_2720 [Leptospira santarosai serovar Arenal str. MAVJ 401]
MGSLQYIAERIFKTKKNISVASCVRFRGLERARKHGAP